MYIYLYFLKVSSINRVLRNLDSKSTSGDSNSEYEHQINCTNYGYYQDLGGNKYYQLIINNSIAKSRLLIKVDSTCSNE
jgi:hypothetical protein